jgi:serine/threonine protein kinase
MTVSRKILIDGDILFADPKVITRIRQKNGIPIITGFTLQTILDSRSSDNEEGRNARYFLREIGSGEKTTVAMLPGDEQLFPSDNLNQYHFEGGPVYVFNRDNAHLSSVTARLIDIATDYGMILITSNTQTKRYAESRGVTTYLWTGPIESKSPKNSQDVNSSKKGRIKPFLLCASPTNTADTPIAVRSRPASGSIITTSSGRTLRLGKQISSGGEGVIYETGVPDEVCKIYHANKLTELKRRKIELMASRKIIQRGICWPSDLVLNEHKEFVGYTMPRANGKTMQTSMFVKPVLEKNFPNWTRRDLAKVSMSFLEHVSFLHSLNIIVGDINPLNFLVTNNSSELWLVDTDSFQIEAFPCPVGTVNFTAPEIQGTSYSAYLRTKDHELFAVATMLFMILHPGKPPYSQQGGGTPSDNIKAMDFPYRFTKDDQQFTGKNAPQGPWQLIWNHLPFGLREAFHKTFRLNERVSVSEWITLMKKYLYSIEKGHVSDDLFPSTFYKIRDPIEIVCDKCKIKHINSKSWVEKLKQQGRLAWCPECTQKNKLTRLANQSRREADQLSFKASTTTHARTNSPSTPPRPQTASARSANPKPTQKPSNSGSADQSSVGMTILGFILNNFFK